MKKTLYDILEVSRTASPEVIRAAYKSLVQRYHPDKNPDNPQAVELLKEINNAYEVLSDPAKRTGYEIQLAAEAEEMPPPPPPKQEEEAAEATTVEPWSERDFSSTWEIHQAYIGKNADYYQPHFRKYLEGKKVGPSFNLPAILLGGIWAAYRKMYGLAGGYVAISAAAAIFSLALQPPLATAALALVAALWIGIGLFANAFYCRQAEARIRQISAAQTDPTLQFREARTTGGVNPKAAALFALLPLAAAVANLLLAPEQTEKKPQPVQAEAPPAATPPAPETESAPEAALPPPSPLPEQPPSLPPAATALPAAPPAMMPVAPKPQPKAAPPEHVAKLAPRAPVIAPPATPVIQPVRPAPSAVPKYSDLVTAVSFRDRAAVEKMIAEGADVNLMKNNQFPLIVAVKNGDAEMVKLLISKGADINVTDSTGNTAMMYAKIKADARMIEILKNAGAKNPFE